MPSRKVHCVANSFSGSAEVAAGLSNLLRKEHPAPSPQPKRNFTRRRVLRRGDWLQTPLRHASNPCGSFSLRASAKFDVYKVYDFFVMIFSFETIAGAPSE